MAKILTRQTTCQPVEFPDLLLDVAAADRCSRRDRLAIRSIQHTPSAHRGQECA